MVCVVSTATVASLSQLVIIVCRFLNFHFASSHSSLMHVLVSGSLSRNYYAKSVKVIDGYAHVAG